MYCPDGSAKAIICPNGQMTFWLGAANSQIASNASVANGADLRTWKLIPIL
jgi:hypothetical protein